MDKEQEILKKLEKLRVEQLKALKELKKVEKAKKKQRRRTAHGYPGFTKSGGNKNNTTTDNNVTTPAQDQNDVMGTSSKSCSRIGGARIKAKFTPNLKSVPETESEKVSVSSTNEDKSSSIQDAVQVKKTEVKNLEPHKTELVKQKEVLATRSIGSSKDISFNAHGIPVVSKPTTSLDLTPKTSLFADTKAENMPARVVEQRNPGRLTKSLKLSRKVRSSRSKSPKTVSVSERQASLKKIRKAETIAGTVLEKISGPRGISGEAEDSESNTNTKHAECSRQDSGLRSTSKNTSRPRTNDIKVEFGEQKHSKPDSKSLEKDRKEKLLSTSSTVSSHNQQFDDFSQSIFSQSLFDDNLEDQSAKGIEQKEESVNELGSNDLSYCCEPLTNRKGNHGTDSCRNVVDVANKNINKGLVCNKQKGKKIHAVNKKEKMECAETNLNTLPHVEKAADNHTECKTATSSDTSRNNALQIEREDDPIPLKEKKEKSPTNFPKDDAEITKELASSLLTNSFSNMLMVEEEVQDDNLSTSAREDAPFQQGKTGRSSMPSSRKMLLPKNDRKETGNNQASLLDGFESRYLLEDTDRQLERQENTSSQSINDNIAADYNKISEHADTLLKEQTEELQPERIEDILKDFPQIVDIFANELRVDDTNSKFKTESETKNAESEAKKQKNTISQELKNLQSIQDKSKCVLDELLLSQPSSPLPQNEPSEGHSSQRVTPILPGICLQHSLSSPGSCNEVRAIKFLTHQVGETRLDMIAVCLSRLLVLWKAVDKCEWVVMHKWLLGEDEEIIDMEVASVGSCIVLITGGNFHRALGRVYVVHDKGDCKFDIYEEVSFSDLGETVYTYKEMCLLPNKESTENVSIVLASAFEEKIVLTKWTIDLICFCLEDCKDLPDVIGNEMSSLCLVQGSKCLLLGFVDSDVYLWNYNSCELLCRMTLQIGLLTKPVCLSAETDMGLIFLSLLYKEENRVDLVAINPQTSREAHLKTLDMVHAIEDKSNRLLHCSKTGAYVTSSFQHGQILLWNIATDEKTVLDQTFGDVYCISLHPEDSVIAFGTVSGCVYLNLF